MQPLGLGQGRGHGFLYKQMRPRRQQRLADREMTVGRRQHHHQVRQIQKIRHRPAHVIAGQAQIAAALPGLVTGINHIQARRQTQRPPGRQMGRPKIAKPDLQDIAVHGFDFYPSTPCMASMVRMRAAAMSGSRSRPAASARRNNSARCNRERALCWPPTMTK